MLVVRTLSSHRSSDGGVAAGTKSDHSRESCLLPRCRQPERGAHDVLRDHAFLWLIQTFWTFDPSVYYISTIPVHVLAEDVLLVAGSAILISFVATVHPANQAAKLEPVAALRYE